VKVAVCGVDREIASLKARRIAIENALGLPGPDPANSRGANECSLIASILNNRTKMFPGVMFVTAESAKIRIVGP
jgi:hypothetical protein